MLYLLDTANIEEIKHSFDLYPLAGLTTNPTLIAREKKDFPGLLFEIRSVIGSSAMLHVQVLGETAEMIVRQANKLMDKVGGNLYVKIPVLAEGIKAIRLLHAQGIKTTATAVFTPQQALLAAVAGADFVAPYVNRLDNICGDGVGVVGEIAELFRIHQLGARVLAASFKNTEQVHRASLAGSHAVTVNAEILAMLLEHPLTQSSVQQFGDDWKSSFGATWI